MSLIKRGSTLEDSLNNLEVQLLDTKPNMKKVMSSLPEVCNNISKITINDLKHYPSLLKFIGSDDNNTIDGNSNYRRFFQTKKTVNECKQNLRNLLKSPKDGGLPIDANTWNNNAQIKEIIEKQTNQNLAFAMTNLNNDFEFSTEAYEEPVQRNDEGTSPEINKIKAENNIKPRIAFLLSGNPTKERMKPYYENMGIKDKVFYGQAWLNIKRACNLNKLGKSNIFRCGETFLEMFTDIPEINIIIIKFKISQIEKELNVLQKKKDEIDTINANVRELPGIIEKVNLEKHENYEAESTNLKIMFEFYKNRQEELIADSSIPSSDALLEQINKLKPELDKLRSEETILLDKFNSSTTDPTINVGSQLPFTTSAGGRRKKFSLRRHIFGHQITRRKLKSKRSFKKKRKASRRTRKKRFF